MIFSVEAPPIERRAVDPLNPKTRSSLSYQEEECVRLLVNYGAHELEPDISVCHYMLSELGTMEFVTPVFNEMLREIREGFVANEIRTADYFLKHQNQEYQHQVIGLVTFRHQLSENWLKHEIYVPTEVDKLADAAFSNILRLKKLVAEQRMRDIKQQIVQATDPAESDRLMVEYMHYKKVDIEIGRLLGTVIS